MKHGHSSDAWPTYVLLTLKEMSYKYLFRRPGIEARGYSLALLLGIVIASAGIFLQLKFADQGNAVPDYARYRLLGAILVTFGTVIGTVGTTYLFRAFWFSIVEKGKDLRFREFFGESAVKDVLRLVHAQRTLLSKESMDFVSPTARHARETWKDKERAICPEGVQKWLSAEDNYAAMALTSLFAQRTAGFPRQVYDSFVEDDAMEFCVIGLGLGFNEFTHFGCTLTRGRMFRIVFKPSVKEEKCSKNPKALEITDEFVVPICVGDNIEWRYPKPSDDTDIALILRVPTPKRTDESEYVTQFVVAGRSAMGTAVAGAYLATQWEKLHRLYQGSANIATDALLVILEHKRSPRISGLDPGNVICNSGARFYLGEYVKIDPEAITEEEAANLASVNFDDKKVVRKFAESIKKDGYGFYNPNVVENETRQQLNAPPDPINSPEVPVIADPKLATPK